MNFPKITHIQVNHEPTTEKSLGFNEGLNWGRFLGSTPIPYSFSISKTDFLKTLAEDYAKVLAEIKADDEKHGDSSDFKAAGYPTLEELLNNPKALKDILETYLLRESLLPKILTSPSPSFIINSLEGIELLNNQLVFKGKGYFSRILH
ncbi:MAG: hypothetical protein SchgKO_16530 [Schleiferiaceae bacterium]